MSVKRGTVAMFIATLLRNVLAFVAIGYFSRAVGTQSLGSYFLFQTLLTLFLIPADFGMQIAVEKRLSEGERPGSVVGSALAFKVALVAVFSILILLARGLIADYVGTDVAYLLIVGLLVVGLAQLGKHILKGENRVSETAIFEPLQTAAWIGFGALLLELELGIESIFYAYVGGYIIVAAIAFYRINSPIGRPEFGRIHSMLDYSKYAMMGNIGGVVYSWADVILLGIFISQTAVGAYEVAWRVAAASLLLSNSIQTAIFPQINRWGADGHYEKLESLVEKALLPSLYLVIPALAGVAILGTEILDVLFAIQYPLLGVVAVILMFENLQRAVVVVLIPPMHAVGRVDAAAKTTFLGVVVNILANLLLIPHYGVVGAAIGTTLGASANSVTHAWVLRQYIDIRVPWHELLWCTLSAALMAGVLLKFKPVVSPFTIPTLLLFVAAGAAVYVAATTLSRPVRNVLRQTAPLP